MNRLWRSILLTPNVLGSDGVSTLSREIARALPAPVLILSLHERSASAEETAVGIEIRGARGNRERLLLAALGAARETNGRTAVVCSHLHLGPLAKLVAWRGPRPTVVLCGIEAWVRLRPLERWALASSDLVAISRHTIERFKSANPSFASTDITVCHPGVPEAVPTALSSSWSALIVARMSASERYKGHDALLDIWPRVRARHGDAVLTIAGDGDDRPRLESRARDLGLQNAVRFTGRVSDAELRALYDACRFFVMPSRDEGFGLGFLEAMRAGKACIGAAGAAAEIIDAGRTGLVVDPADRDALADAVCSLYDDGELCARMGRAGRERFLSEFTDRQFQIRFDSVLTHSAPVRLATSVS